VASVVIPQQSGLLFWDHHQRVVLLRIVTDAVELKLQMSHPDRMAFPPVGRVKENSERGLQGSTLASISHPLGDTHLMVVLLLPQTGESVAPGRVLRGAVQVL